MTNFIFLFFALIFNCATNVLPCGPGSGTSRGRIREHNIKGNRLPNVPETSHAASGTFEGVKHRTDPRLVSLLSTDIVFEDKSYNAASRMSIKVFKFSLPYFYFLYILFHSFLNKFFGLFFRLVEIR